MHRCDLTQAGTRVVMSRRQLRPLIQISKTILRIQLILASMFVAVSIGVACNIPVFRYALERWKPDATEVLIFHDAPLSQSHKQTLQQLQARTVQHDGDANAKVIQIDIASDLNADNRDVWLSLSEQDGVSLPHVLVRTKSGQGRWINHWHGPLEDLPQLGLYDSPARAELGRRLMAGHSVVWLLIGSTNDAKTASAKTLVQSNFESLSERVKLPEGIGLPGSELYADVPLVVKFSLLEIDPDDPEEQFLVSLLTGVRQQAFEDGEPLLVPVFGRGRALEVIPASDMTEKLMEELTVFLSGACSCQVKERNPGFDLLINADWDTELFGDDANRPPDRSAEEGRNREPELLQIPPGR
tara:strand:- start:71306 stop:72373 length:1068 start_codon:yes stop_codon:yes gene_type:complete